MIWPVLWTSDGLLLSVMPAWMLTDHSNMHCSEFGSLSKELKSGEILLVLGNVKSPIYCWCRTVVHRRMSTIQEVLQSITSAMFHIVISVIYASFVLICSIRTLALRFPGQWKGIIFCWRLFPMNIGHRRHSWKELNNIYLYELKMKSMRI